jgi:uncharacterized protein (DUF4415 family)
MNMKTANGNGELKTSKQARAVGLKRIARRHLTKPGKVKLSDCKVRVTMYLDADVLEYFKSRAVHAHAAPYQTQINAELRAVMDRSSNGAPYASLVEDDRFIAAVAKRVQHHRVRRD